MWHYIQCQASCIASIAYTGTARWQLLHLQPSSMTACADCDLSIWSVLRIHVYD